MAGSSPHRTVLRCLLEWAQERPDRVFCTFLKSGLAEEITYGHLVERGAAYAAAFRKIDVNAGDIVVTMLRHSPHQYYAFVGAMMIGAIPTFMPFPTPKQRPDVYWRDHQALFDRLRPRVVVSYRENIAAAHQYAADGSFATLEADDALFNDAVSSIEPAITAESVACLQHSSGTTGLKKGVMLTHRAILDQVDSYARAIDLGSEDCIASWLPLYHDMGFIACFLMPMIVGAQVVQMDPFEWAMKPLGLLSAIEEYKSTFCWLPNFAFAHVVNNATGDRRWDLSNMRAFINCSEPCKARVFDRFLERFSSSGVRREMLHACYAMAENVFGVTQSRLGASVASHGAALSCGRPIDGVAVEIRDGEIYIRSKFLFDGYYRQPDLTAERLCDGWFRTNDCGYINESGELFVLGRVDDILIVNGRNYYAHELEAVASDAAGVIPGRAVAFTVDDEASGIANLVVAVESQEAESEASVASAVRKSMLEVIGLVPSSVVVVAPGTLVKTTSGKISRKENRALHLRGDFG